MEDLPRCWALVEYLRGAAEAVYCRSRFNMPDMSLEPLVDMFVRGQLKPCALCLLLCLYPPLLLKAYSLKLF